MAKKILVVDDEPDVVKVVSFRLKKAGYEVFTADNGKKGLDSVTDNRPDLVLLDLRMPVMSGYDVCKQIKSDDKLKNIPVILLTASGAGTIANSAKEYNADDYIVKPFNPEELLEKVKKYLK